MRVVFTIVFLLMVFGCEKSENRQCLKFVGSPIEKRIELPEFQSLLVGPRLIVDLVQDSVNFMTLKGGKNLLEFVKYDKVQGRLKLLNSNKCNFLRSPQEKIHLTVHYKKIDSLFFDNTEPVRFFNPLINNRLYALVQQIAGHIEMDMNVQYFFLETAGAYADVIIKGSTRATQTVVKGNCTLDARAFVIKDRLVAMNWSVGNMLFGEINDTLAVEIKNKGNVYYSGEPSHLNFERLGTGQLIRK